MTLFLTVLVVVGMAAGAVILARPPHDEPRISRRALQRLREREGE